MPNSPIRTFVDGYQFPDNTIQATAVVSTSWTSYTPTFSSGFGVVTGIDFKWARTGNTIKVIGQFTSGTMSNDTYEISLPNSLTLATIVQSGDLLGLFTFNQDRGDNNFYIGGSSSASGVNLYNWNSPTGAYSIITTTGPLPNSGSIYYLNFDVPLDG